MDTQPDNRNEKQGHVKYVTGSLGKPRHKKTEHEGRNDSPTDLRRQDQMRADLTAVLEFGARRFRLDCVGDKRGFFISGKALVMGVPAANRDLHRTATEMSNQLAIGIALELDLEV